MITKKNIKIVDILIKWDTSGDNVINKAEFRKHVVELGVEASAKDIDACFESYDKDGGGSLDESEALQVRCVVLVMSVRASVCTWCVVWCSVLSC